MKSHTITLVGVLAAAATAGARGAVINVPGDVPTIQIAINIAVNGDEIVVAPGTYFETITLLGKQITLRSSGGPGVTTIDAFGQFDSAIHAVSGETLDTVLEGFTITRGDADGIDDGDPEADERGGGLFVNLSEITVLDCVFIDNTALNVGGAVYVNGGGGVAFTECTFETNQSGHGGGVYLNATTANFADCAFVDNDAMTGNGGGLSSVSSTTTLDRCAFEGNIAAAAGGAVNFSGTMTATATTFTGNDAANGGAFWATGNLTLRDSVLNGNVATGSGGAVYVSSAGVVTMVNATLTQNSGPDAALWNNGTATLTSCILWANANADTGNAPVTVTYSIIAGGTGTNKDLDPLFVDAAGGDATPGTADDDLRLSATSPAIDAGDASAVIGEYPVDLDGNPRAANDPDTADTGLSVLGLAVDMGAYELQPAGGNPSCPADVDGNGSVGTSDLLLLLSAWGPCP